MNRKIYRKTAKAHGVSVKEVKEGMQAAINEAYKKPNFHANQINCKGETPTPSEFISHATQRSLLVKMSNSGK